MLELYVWLKMGGTKDGIILKPLSSADTTAALAKFDCARAKCFHVADREKILAVIETGFGDTQPFNRIIRNLFSTQAEARSTRTSNLEPEPATAIVEVI